MRISIVIANMVMLANVVLLCGAATIDSQPGVSQPQDTQPPKQEQKQKQRQEPQRWLKQLVGEWDVEFKMYMLPDVSGGGPPSKASGKDSVRAIGEHWIVAESNTTIMGLAYTSVMTLGYNQQDKRFQGTYIDSMSDHLWTYKGSLNEAGTALTLETKGPSALDPSSTATYRETHEIKSTDHRTFTSAVQMDDGEWSTLLAAEYRRAK